MTEITVHKQPLPPAIERFVLHWGEMGTRWGVNRSVSQIHALLYVSEQPLTAEDIADTLSLARSNVSTSLRELMGWNLIRRVHVMGDRRDFYAAETDLWEMLRRIAAGRKQRELDQTMDVITACAAEAADDPKVSAVAKARLKDMSGFMHDLDRWYGEVMRLPKPTLIALSKMGGAIARLISPRLGRTKEEAADADTT